MKHTDNDNPLDRLVKGSLNSAVPPEVEARLRRHLAAFREKMESAEREPQRRANIVAMLFSPPRRALAYALPIAAVLAIGVVVLTTAGGFNPAKAYAQAVEQLRKAHTLTYTLIVPQAGIVPMPLRMEFSYKEPGLIRYAMAEGTWAVMDINQMKGLTLIPREKKYIAMDFSSSTLPSQQTPIDYIEGMRRIPTRASEVLARRQLEGRTVQDYRVTTGGLNLVVSVDVETGDLVRMEGEFVNAPGINVVITNFRFDVQLDDSLFSLTPPPDYQAIALPEGFKLPSEDDLVYFLRGWAAHNLRELFPPSLHPMEMMEAMKGMKQAGELIDETVDKEQEMQVTLRMTQGIMFVMQMKPENDWHYAGKDVRLGAADKAIFWYKPDGKSTYRVIYGDLSVRDVAAGDVPTTAALPAQP